MKLHQGQIVTPAARVKSGGSIVEAAPVTMWWRRRGSSLAHAGVDGGVDTGCVGGERG